MPSVEVFTPPSLNSRLETTARRYATRLAVQDETRALTFAEFSDEVGTLAERLQLVIEPGDHVAVQLPRGLDYIVAAYAIWQAGGVYLPLDDQWPSSRLLASRFGHRCRRYFGYRLPNARRPNLRTLTLYRE